MNLPKRVIGFAFLLVVHQAGAQSFNIDFGQGGTGPSASYGAAGKVGYWNSLAATNGNNFILKDLDGNTTNVQFSQSGAAGLIAASDPSVSGNDSLLMNDGLITYAPSLDSCFYFNGLEPGTYELTTYAWRPDYPAQMAKSFTDDTPGLELSGGAWPGYHAHGITFARQIVIVDESGFMGPHSGLAAGANAAVGAVCNGMQLRLLGPSVPTLGGYGMGVLALAMLCAATWVIHTRARTLKTAS